MNQEIIEIKSANELPANVEFVLYEQPFQSDELHEIVSSFTHKYGYEPSTIYRLSKQWFVVKNR